MARIAIPLLLLALLLAPAALAQAPAPQRVWTVFTTVQADVVANYATVRVIVDIGNRGPDPEFPFQVRVPDDAFVSGLTIERDGTVYEAQIKPRDEARAQYEQTKAQQQTGGLVEKDRHSSVYAYLVNVAEFTNVRATLTYERYLAAERGVYNVSLEAPVSGFGQDQGARFDVTVRDPAGVESAWGTPNVAASAVPGGYALGYQVGPRPNDSPTPFVASYTLKPTGDAGSLLTYTQNGTGYFAHRFRAPPDATRMPVDMALVLDVSGSMSGLKMQQMKDAAGQLVRGLSGDDRLNLVVFSSSATSVWPGLRAMGSANRSDAAREIEALLAGGGTNLEAALRSGFAGFQGLDASREQGRLPLFVLLTDGQATEGNTNRDALRALAKDANAHGADVFAVAFGQDADWSFIHGIAEDGNGTALRVPEGQGAEVDLRRFLAALSTPVLKDVAVSYGPGVTSYRTAAPVLFAGSELLVVGTFDAAKGMPDATVTAQAPDGARSYTTKPVVATAPFLPRLVASQRIHALEATIDAEGARQEWVDEVKQLALRWGFVTDYTSLVLSLEPRTAPPTATTPTSATPMPAPTTAGSNASGAMVVADQASPYPYDAVNAGATRGAPVPTSTTWASSAPVGSTPASPAVPGPGAWMLVVALAAALLVARKRR